MHVVDVPRASRGPAQRSRSGAAIAAALLTAVTLTGTGASAASAPACASPHPGGPLWINADCVDPTYNHPVIDSQQDITGRVPYRKVSGHFEGTNARFTFSFPPPNRWQGRFFQLVYPLQDENALDPVIAFNAASGAYGVQTNSAGSAGYRVDAAAAKFAKHVAASYYQTDRRIYGYIYGGSGGSYQTFGAMENTTSVWDGAVPFIPGAPTSIPNNFFVRAFARFALQGKAPRIADAVRPGGTGDPYAHLSTVERAVLTEVTKMGIPLRAWQNYSYVLGLDDPQGLLGFSSTVRAIDPTYVDDFWSKPGYLGTERSPLGALVRTARMDYPAGISKVNRDAHGQPSSLQLASVPANPANLLLDFTAYRPDGTTKIGTLTGTLEPATRVLTLDSGNSPDVLGALTADGTVRMNNTWSLALLAYHRHQVPTQPGFHAWDQFRGPDGHPIYPQRPIQVGPVISSTVTGGGTFTGNTTGKMIVVANILDTDAFPWDADWYSKQAKHALGPRYDDVFRLWYNDNADHLGAHLPGLVDYLGIVQQALRDVSNWAEKGVEPPRSTRYDIVNSQVLLPPNARQRQGIQPVVHLTAGGADRLNVRAGKPVTFHGVIQVPPGAGQLTTTEWDFTGSGTFTAQPFGPSRNQIEVSATFTYQTPGTYTATLRVTANRNGDPTEPFANALNLGQVRVVVH